MLIAMAEPRLGYEVHDIHRRGLDLIVVADVSKSMLATDVTPNRLTREKLSVQDLVAQLGGDRLGLVAFAGSAFLQAPLTVDYDAVLSAAAELDTDLIPRGGTNIGGAIDLALEAFGKVEAGNRAIVLLSDGEPTTDSEQADGVKAAGRAAAAGVKVFTVGIGTTEGSLIPLDANGTEFVRDEDGKIVRTRLDENNLREIARAGNGFYLRFTSGDATMRALVGQGLSQLKTGEIDARSNRRPVERYQWPLAAALLFLGLAALVGERRRTRAPVGAREGDSENGGLATGSRRVPATAVAAALAAAVLSSAAAAGAADTDASAKSAASPSGSALDLYRDGRYEEAYRAFEELAKQHPNVGSLQFNAGASAYQGRQYDEALDAFGRALTSDDAGLQAKSHYNFGNTLFRRGEEQKDRDARVKDWKNAIQHYDSTLDALKRSRGANNPLMANTTYNRDLVQKRLDEEEKQPPQNQQQKKDQQKQDRQQKNQQQQRQDQQQNQGKQQSQSHDGQQSDDGQQQDQQPQQGQSDRRQQQKDQQQNQSSSGNPQGKDQDANQSPKSGDGSSSHDRPPEPSASPDQDKPRQRGDFQSQPGSTPKPDGSPSPSPDQPADASEEAGKMSPAQARALLDSLKGEDEHVQSEGRLDNHQRTDEPVTKDW